VLLPPKPILPRESNSNIVIFVLPVFEPRNIGYLLSLQLCKLLRLESTAAKVCYPQILGAIDVNALAKAISLTVN
jgi:hypothetical protein